MAYEYPVDYQFSSTDEAVAWKEEHYPNEDWHLVEVTLKPVLRHHKELDVES